MIELQDKIDWDLIDISQLSLMAPGSGPWCLLHAHDFKLSDSKSYFSFLIKGDIIRYVGEFTLLDDWCGMNNLLIIYKQLNKLIKMEA